MLKTNNKQVKERIREYLKECNFEMLERYGEEETTEKPFSRIAQLIINEIGYDRKYYHSFYCDLRNKFHQQMFIDYIQGGSYATCIYWEQKELLKEWLEESEEEANCFTYEKTEHVYLTLLYREFDYMLRKENK